MTKITDGHVVEMNYTLTNSKGEILDSSESNSPLAYIQGKKNIIPGLEKEMTGKKVGDTFKVTVKPEEAYGYRNEAMVQPVAKEQFGPEASEIQVGMQFELESDDGQVKLATAIEVRKNEIVLDANHPLAGETLNFDVEVIGVKEATKEELEKGYL